MHAKTKHIYIKLRPKHFTLTKSSDSHRFSLTQVQSHTGSVSHRISLLHAFFGICFNLVIPTQTHKFHPKFIQYNIKNVVLTFKHLQLSTFLHALPGIVACMSVIKKMNTFQFSDIQLCNRDI